MFIVGFGVIDSDEVAVLVECVGLSEDEGLLGVHDEVVHLFRLVKDLHLCDGAWFHRPTLSAKSGIGIQWVILSSSHHIISSLFHQ